MDLREEDEPIFVLLMTTVLRRGCAHTSDAAEASAGEELGCVLR